MSIDTIALAGEALVAVVGLTPSVPVTRKQGAEAERLPRDWKDAVDGLFDGKAWKFRDVRQIADLDTAFKAISPMSVADATKLTGEITNPEISQAFRDCFLANRQTLFTAWPRPTRETVTGEQNLPVGRLETARIEALYAVLNRPARVLDELRMGTLTSVQARAFTKGFPQLSAMLNLDIWNAAVERQSKDKNYVVPWRIERLIRILLDKPGAVPISPPKAAKQGGGEQPKVNIDFSREQTRSQELAAPPR